MGICNKIAIFARRAKEASVKRMWRNVRAIHKDTGKNSLVLLGDMLWCSVHYGIGYLEYRVFGFEHVHGQKRKTFMTMPHNVGLARMLNDRECYPILNDKMLFLKTFQDFLGRDYLDLRESDAEGLRDFCKEKGRVFVKPLDAFGGKGVEALDYDQKADWKTLYADLMEHHQYLVEEAIRQHEGISRLCASSVNTLRVVTLLVDGVPHVAYTLLRIGSGKSHVDNISSGGMYTFVEPDGVLHYPAFCDKTSLFYEEHPVSHVKFVGYVLPYYQEAVELCKKAALVEPRLGYIGWDVAITVNGPVLVEGNNIPGYDMPQNAGFHPDGIGILPHMEKILGKPVPKA